MFEAAEVGRKLEKDTYKAQVPILRAELLDALEVGDRVLLVVQTQAPPEWGKREEPHGEFATVRDGKVVEIVVYPDVADAIAAAGAAS